MAERIPRPIVRGKFQGLIRARSIRNGGIGCLEKLVGSEARQLLHVSDVHNRVRRNRSMPRSDHAVQMIDAVYSCPKHLAVGGIDTLRARGGNLRVGERIGEAHRRTAAPFKVSPYVCRVAVEQAGEGQQTLSLNV